MILGLAGFALVFFAISGLDKLPGADLIAIGVSAGIMMTVLAPVVLAALGAVTIAASIDRCNPIAVIKLGLFVLRARLLALSAIAVPAAIGLVTAIANTLALLVWPSLTESPLLGFTMHPALRAAIWLLLESTTTIASVIIYLDATGRPHHSGAPPPWMSGLTTR